jgi:hypothetical protein
VQTSYNVRNSLSCVKIGIRILTTIFTKTAYEKDQIALFFTLFSNM